MAAEEYRIVHQHELREIAGLVDSHIASRDPDIYLATDFVGNTSVQKGIVVTPEDLIPGDEMLTEAEADALGHSVRELSVLAHGRVQFEVFLLAAMVKGTLRVKYGQDISAIPDRPMERLESVHLKDVGSISEMSRVLLTGVPLIEEARTYAVTHESDDFSTTLSMFAIGKAELLDGVVTVSMGSDELMYRAETVLGAEGFLDLLPVISGYYRDDTELDEILSDLVMSYTGSHQEDAISPLLDEVRTRAQASRLGVRLATETHLTIPNQEQLAEFANALRTAL